MSVNRFGMVMAEAAYLHGDDWLDALLVYLDGNRQLLSDELSHIPGVSVMPLQSTYLAWVDFAGTGMPAAEFINRIQTAGVAASHGSTFGAGGDSFMRFNIATPRARVATAMQRLRTAFSDLQ
jgi:cystathionine beta-lyase